MAKILRHPTKIMRKLRHLFERNRKWAEARLAEDPSFFKDHAEEQNPNYLWIGCSDSRVSANQVVDLPPGEIFVHRNIANVVAHTDFNSLSVIEFAVQVLKVKHIIVCGHHGCGGVNAAMTGSELGLSDNWLRHIRDVYDKHRTELSALAPGKARLNRLCELNVVEQVYNVCYTTIVQQAWRDGQELCVHGWIYGMEDGLIQDLNLCVANREDLNSTFHAVGSNIK